MRVMKFALKYISHLQFEVFKGNSDKDTIITNTLNPPIARAQFVRILPQKWHNHISLRFDILGCVVKGKHRIKIKVYMNCNGRFVIISFAVQ